MNSRRIFAFVLILCLLLGNTGSLLAVPAKAAEVGEITVDGNAEDWYYIEPLYMGGGIVSKLSAFTAADTLYLKMEVSNTASYDTWHIYFDTDGDHTNHLYFKGADYMIETDWFYRYEGDSGEWSGLVSTETAVKAVRSDDKKILEISVPLEAFGGATQIGINGAVVVNWVDVASNPTPGEYLPVPALEDVLRDTMAGLSAEEQEALEASRQFAGTRTQWESIDYDAVFKNSNLKTLKAVSDGEYLYVSAAAKKLSNNFTLYIGTQEDGGGSDRSEIWTDGQDMDFQMKSNGVLYRMKGDRRADMGTKIADFYKSDAGFEAKIPLSLLGTEGTVFAVGLDDEGETLPDGGSELLKAVCPIMEEAPAITVDGDPGDWSDVAPIGKGEQTLGDLYAFRDNEALYVMTYIKGVTDPEASAAYTTSLFIDSDNNTETGFQHTGYPGHSGGNFLIQDWHSYGEDRNLEFFYTNDPVVLPWNMKKQFVEGFEKVFAEVQPGVYCAEWKVPIAVMEEVDVRVCDDLYICIDRDDCQTDEETYERLTPYGYTPAVSTTNAAFAKVPKYQIQFDMKFDDFDLTDWDGVCNEARHEKLENLCAVRTDEKLFTITTNKSGLTTDIDYYIGTDAAGYRYGAYEGISYVVTRGRLYQVVGDDQLADSSETVYQNYTDSAVLMQLYLSQIGDPSVVKLAVCANGTLTLPETGMLTTTKTVTVEREEGTYYPMEAFDAYNNPYKGWVAWANAEEGDVNTIAAAYDLVYVDIKWDEIEKEKGVYDFDFIEKQYQFDKWLAQGKRMVLRFVMDNPGLDPSGDPDIQRMDIPQWLYDELLAENAEGEGAGTFYNGSDVLTLLGGVGFSPNYKSPKLLQYHRNLVEALAQRYDDPNITAYVEVGSLGHWAEFHCWPTGTGEFPDPQLAQEYMRPYADYFHNVRVGIRKPYALAAENQWGLYNDVFGVTFDGGTRTFLEWAATGNVDMPGSTEEDIQASKMPEWWKANFSGGEFANGNFRTNAEDGNICEVLNQIRDSHTSWLGPCSACNIKVDDGDYDTYSCNIEAMLKTMGYRYNLQSVTQVSEAAQGQAVELKLVWNNSGVAPIYYNCPVQLSLLDGEGKTVVTHQLDTDTRTWQPGRTTENTVLEIPADLPVGEYTLCVKMSTPDDAAEPIYLAMQGRQEDGSYTLYQMTVGEASETVETQPETVPATEQPETVPGPEQPEAESSGLWLLAVVAVGAVCAVVFLRKNRRGKKTGG